VKSYVDGFLRERDGLLDIGVFDHGLIDTNALPLLTDDDLDGDPDLLPTSYDDVQTTFFASYSDKDHYYQKRAQKYDDPSARRQVGEERRVIDERDWITDGAIAKRWVTEAGRIRILPGQSGPIPVKREWLDNAPAVGGGTYGQVREGDRFVWNSASLGLTQLLWIGETEWPEDRSGQTTLHVENERGYWPSNYIPPADTSLGDYVIKPVEIVTHRILELPSGELKTSNTREIAVLALRTDAAMRGFHVHTSVDNSSFVLASEHNHFAVFGKIKTADYVATTPVVDTTVGMVVDLYGADLDQLTPQSNQQRDDNAWLAICGNEILSVGDVVALGSGRYRVYFRRGLYGTAIANHAIDTDVWFIPRANITPIANANFINGATRYFKLQPYTQTHELDLAGVTSFAFTFGTGPFVLSGLELAGQGNDFVFIGRNPKFAWRLYSIFGAEISGQQLSLGAYDDQFAQFNLRVRDAESGDVVWTGSSKVPEYVFDYEQNALCVDGPRREFYFAVAALSRSGEQTPWEEIEVNNPNETFDQAGSVGGGINAIDFLLSPSTALDHAGCILWRSLDPDFEVDPEEDWSVVGAVHAGVELVFKGPDNFFSVPQDEGTTYYYRVAAYDDFWNGDIADLIIGAAVAQFTMDTSRPPPAVSPGSHSFTDPFVASMTADEGLVVRYRLDGTEATIGAIEWPKVDGVYTTLPISETCILRVRGFDANGVPTKELIIFYTKVASGGGGVERCGAVSIHFSGRQGYTAGTIILTAATPGGTIHKSVNGAAYSDYTAPFVLNLDEIVEAYESAPGLVDGPVSSFDNPDPT
jgi:hypothetical protein